jgi:hypothetical protein
VCNPKGGHPVSGHYLTTTGKATEDLSGWRDLNPRPLDPQISYPNPQEFADVQNPIEEQSRRDREQSRTIEYRFKFGERAEELQLKGAREPDLKTSISALLEPFFHAP